MARSHLLTGFPWNLPAMVFGNWVYAAQPVAWVGIHGLGLMALIAAALIGYPAWRARLAGLALIVAVFAAGASAGGGAGNHGLSDRRSGFADPAKY